MGHIHIHGLRIWISESLFTWISPIFIFIFTLFTWFSEHSCSEPSDWQQRQRSAYEPLFPSTSLFEYPSHSYQRQYRSQVLLVHPLDGSIFTDYASWESSQKADCNVCFFIPLSHAKSSPEDQASNAQAKYGQFSSNSSKRSARRFGAKFTRQNMFF